MVQSQRIGPTVEGANRALIVLWRLVLGSGKHQPIKEFPPQRIVRAGPGRFVA